MLAVWLPWARSWKNLISSRQLDVHSSIVQPEQARCTCNPPGSWGLDKHGGGAVSQLGSLQGAYWVGCVPGNCTALCNGLATAKSQFFWPVRARTPYSLLPSSQGSRLLAGGNM